MEINLKWIAAANFVFLALIGFIILFIFLRRLILFPFQVWFKQRKKYYLNIVGKILAHFQEIDENIKIILRVNNWVDRLALEEVLVETIETERDKKKILTWIYKEMGMVMQRVKQLRSRNVWKRRISADLLGKSLSYKAVSPLIAALSDKDEDVRLIAAKGLGKLKATETIDLIISLFNGFPPEKCSIVTNILIDFGEDAIPFISGALKTLNLKTCFWLLRALAEIEIGPDKSKYKDLEEKLEKILLNSGEKIRAYCAICLAKFGQDAAAELLDDPSPFVRAASCRALGILGDKDAIDVLIKHLSDENWNVNYAASRALIKFGRQIKEKIRGNLTHPHDMVHMRCRELLEEMQIND